MKDTFSESNHQEIIAKLANHKDEFQRLFGKEGNSDKSSPSAKYSEKNLPISKDTKSIFNDIERQKAEFEFIINQPFHVASQDWDTFSDSALQALGNFGAALQNWKSPISDAPLCNAIANLLSEHQKWCNDIKNAKNHMARYNKFKELSSSLSSTWEDLKKVINEKMQLQQINAIETNGTHQLADSSLISAEDNSLSSENVLASLANDPDLPFLKDENTLNYYQKKFLELGSNRKLHNNTDQSSVASDSIDSSEQNQELINRLDSLNIRYFWGDIQGYNVQIGLYREALDILNQVLKCTDPNDFKRPFHEKREEINQEIENEQQTIRELMKCFVNKKKEIEEYQQHLANSMVTGPESENTDWLANSWKLMGRCKQRIEAREWLKEVLNCAEKQAENLMNASSDKAREQLVQSIDKGRQMYEQSMEKCQEAIQKLQPPRENHETLQIEDQKTLQVEDGSSRSLLFDPEGAFSRFMTQFYTWYQEQMQRAYSFDSKRFFTGLMGQFATMLQEPMLIESSSNRNFSTGEPSVRSNVSDQDNLILNKYKPATSENDKNGNLDQKLLQISDGPSASQKNIIYEEPKAMTSEGEQAHVGSLERPNFADHEQLKAYVELHKQIKAALVHQRDKGSIMIDNLQRALENQDDFIKRLMKGFMKGIWLSDFKEYIQKRQDSLNKFKERFKEDSQEKAFSQSEKAKEILDIKTKAREDLDTLYNLMIKRNKKAINTDINKILTSFVKTSNELTQKIEKESYTIEIVQRFLEDKLILEKAQASIEALENIDERKKRISLEFAKLDQQWRYKSN